MSEAPVAPTRAPHPNGEPLLSVRGLKVYFPIHKGVFSRVVAHVRAVDGVSFEIHRGRTLGLVGESGCGKTTTGRNILRLVPPTAGEIHFDGIDLLQLTRGQLRGVRRHLQIVFQDPVSSLNPRMSVGAIVAEPLQVHRLARGQALRDRVAELLGRVGLSAADVSRYPHEFSGGQRQRIGIARSIALNPRFIVCDEPVSALDVSIRSQILNLLSDLRDEYGLSYLFIAHDLTVVKHFCHQVAVMYLGKIVEIAPAERIYAEARHPYTLALLMSVPEPDPSKRRERIVLRGEVPSPVDPPPGCPFHTRCPVATEHCRLAPPRLETKPGLSLDHEVACHHADEAVDLSPPPRKKSD